MCILLMTPTQCKAGSVQERYKGQGAAGDKAAAGCWSLIPSLHTSKESGNGHEVTPKEILMRYEQRLPWGWPNTTRPQSHFTNHSRWHLKVLCPRVPSPHSREEAPNATHCPRHSTLRAPQSALSSASPREQCHKLRRGEPATIPRSPPRRFIKQDIWVQPQHPTSSPIPCPAACWCNTGSSRSAWPRRPSRDKV